MAKKGGVKKGKKPHKNKPTSKKYTKYKIEGNTIKRESILKKPVTQSIIGIVLMFLLLGVYLFWQANHGTVFIENSEISAPIINLSSTTAGTLNALYVNEGDTISADTPVALVGTDIVSAKQSGIITDVQNNIGQFFGFFLLLVYL